MNWATYNAALTGAEGVRVEDTVMRALEGLKMTRYERENAAHIIDGYYNPPRDNRAAEAEFTRAKREAIMHARAAVERMNAMLFDEFISARRGANKGQRPLSRDDVLGLLPIVQDGWSATDYGEWVARAVERAHGIVTHNAVAQREP